MPSTPDRGGAGPYSSQPEPGGIFLTAQPRPTNPHRKSAQERRRPGNHLAPVFRSERRHMLAPSPQYRRPVTGSESLALRPLAHVVVGEPRR